MISNKTRNSFLLFLAALIWGTAFIAQSKGMDHLSPFAFNGVRNLIGATFLLGLVLVRRISNPSIYKSINWGFTLKGGILCGIALTCSSMFQQYGILHTTVGKAGFLTTLYVIFVPIAGILFRKKVEWQVWLAAGMGAVGIYLLCMTESFSLSFGDTLVLLCAVGFTVHIMVIDHFSPGTDGVLLSFIQFAFCGIVCTALSFFFGAPTVETVKGALGSLLYAGVMSSGVAFTLQIIAQKDLNPTIAALLMSLESVIATISGVIAYKIGFLKTDQTMSFRQVMGCVIVFTAVILVQLPTEWFHKKKQ